MKKEAIVSCAESILPVQLRRVGYSVLHSSREQFEAAAAAAAFGRGTGRRGGEHVGARAVAERGGGRVCACARY